MDIRALWILAAGAIAALSAGCAQFAQAPARIAGRDIGSVTGVLTVDGKCAVVVSGTFAGPKQAVGQVSLDVYEGIAQIDIGLGPVDAHGSSTFHVVVPVEEQHVDVIYIGQPRRPLWERAAGGRMCEPRATDMLPVQPPPGRDHE